MIRHAYEKVSPIFKILTHHRDLVFQSNERMIPILIKLSWGFEIFEELNCYFDCSNKLTWLY
jgi:hypothetical protein